MKMTRDNVLLVEKHDIIQQEILPSLNNQNIKSKIKGIKIFRVIQPINDEFEILCQYDSESDKTDLTALKDHIGKYMVSVDRISENHDGFVWNCFILGEPSDDNMIFSITKCRECTTEEVNLLNEIFPEYFDNAF